jgi:hypothetical protein
MNKRSWMLRTQKITLQSCKTQKNSQMNLKDAKNMKKHKITRIPIHRRRPKKILKKMEKCNKCKETGTKM